MIPIAASKNQFVHSGIAKVLKAYTMITLVDLFGDVPYTQANLGVGNTNPAVDKGRLVYDSALALLDAAIADFAKTSASPPANDLFYAANKAKWTTLAKTIKLKAYVQTRLVDASVTAKISALLTENDLVNTSANDFVFSYSTKDQSPDSRYGHYVGNYGTDNGAGDYIGVHFLWALYAEKGLIDPRLRYYVYRQIDDVTNDPRLPDVTTTQFALACYYRPSPYPANVPYCLVGKGYWGRDHGNNEGIGADGSLRSTWGLYPAAGEFDADQNKAVGQSASRQKGAKGAGIAPIWLSSYTYFLKAEAALMLTGVPGDPQALLVSGVNESFNKVKGFATTVGYTIPTSDTTKLITTFKQQNYVNKVISLYQAAATNDAKLNVIEREYYLAAWGNGLEPYNNYRRTGKPDNFQRTLLPNEGSFIRSFFYPFAYVNFNKNAVQKTTVTTQVFWDNNPADFIH
jgi:hypothetical protein